MPIHYVSAGTRQGPVDESGFMQMITDGRATSDTLVWREDLPYWMPWSDLAAATSLTTPAASAWQLPGAGAEPGVETGDELPEFQARCVRCHGVFDEDDIMLYAAGALCADCKSVLLDYIVEIDTVAPRGMSVTSPPHARFGIRLLARILDGMIIVCGSTGLTLALLIYMGITDPPTSQGMSGGRGALVGGTVGAMSAGLWYLVIEPLMLWLFGATPGKLSTGLRVVTETGGRISLATAFGRSAAANILSMIPVVGLPLYAVSLAGCVAAAFDPLKRGLHDRIFRTRVIVVPEGAKRYRDVP